MKTNTQTAQAFIRGEWANNENTRSGFGYFWSYSTPIAARTQSKTGGVIIFLTPNGYSNTTRKHKAHIIGAAGKAALPLFVVPNLSPKGKRDHKKNLRHLMDKAQEMADKASRARKEETRQYYTTFASEAQNLAQLYKYYFL